MTIITEINSETTITNIGGDEKHIRKMAKSLLKSSLFIGTYQEKRFVESLNAYRDIVKIADDEADLIENLNAVKKRCSNFYKESMWVGITQPDTLGAPVGYNLWVNLEEQVFGSYWYKIKNVEFCDREICIKIEKIRPSDNKPSSFNISNNSDTSINTERLLDDTKAYVNENVKYFFREIITFRNIKESIIFLSLLLSTIITFLVHVIKYLLEYTLKLLHELSGFIKVCTPIFATIMNFFTNIIMGLYMLIAVMCQSKNANQFPNRDNYKAIAYSTPYYNRQSITYPDAFNNQARRNRSSVRITPLD